MADLTKCKRDCEPYERANGVPIGLLWSLAYEESRCDPTRTGPVTKYGRAKGIVQIITQFHPEVSDPYDKNQSLAHCARYLKKHYDRTGSWAMAVASWHSGCAQRIDCVPNSSDGNETTQQYVSNILGRVPLPIDAEFCTIGRRCKVLSRYAPTGAKPSPAKPTPTKPSGGSITTSPQLGPIMIDGNIRKILILGIAVLVIVLAMSK